MKAMIDKLGSILSEIGIPIRYREFKTAPSLPYAVFLISDRRDLAADNRNYFKTYVIELEVYTDNDAFDFELQEKVEEVLEKHELYYQSLVSDIEEHRMYQMFYTFEIREGEL